MKHKNYSSDDYRDLDYNVVDASAHKSTPRIKTGRVDVFIRVKIRSSPNTDYKDENVITTLPDKAEVEILGEENGYYHIRFGDSTGYCDKRFVTIDG